MTPENVSATAVEEAVRRLREAAESGRPCAPVRDLIGSQDVDAAYAVQRGLTAARLAQGARVVGRKIGLTSEAVQRQLGVDQPDFGVLFDDMQVDGASAVPTHRLLQPKIEAEVAFVLQADLDDEDIDAARAASAVAVAVPALEIVDSRIQNWDISFGDTVADNASSGMFVLGAERLTLADVTPAEVEMTMTLNGREVSAGNGAACMGDPLNALAWLARTAREFGEPLRAGQVVLSGALGPMVPVQRGDEIVAEVKGLGTVRAVMG
jgi:2-keto-4-pentenoate hydratase